MKQLIAFFLFCPEFFICQNVPANGSWKTLGTIHCPSEEVTHFSMGKNYLVLASQTGCYIYTKQFVLSDSISWKATPFQSLFRDTDLDWDEQDNLVLNRNYDYVEAGAKRPGEHLMCIYSPGTRTLAIDSNKEGRCFQSYLNRAFRDFFQRSPLWTDNAIHQTGFCVVEYNLLRLNDSIVYSLNSRLLSRINVRSAWAFEKDYALSLWPDSKMLRIQGTKLTYLDKRIDEIRVVDAATTLPPVRLFSYKEFLPAEGSQVSDWVCFREGKMYVLKQMAPGNFQVLEVK